MPLLPPKGCAIVIRFYSEDACLLAPLCSAGGDEDPPREPLELWVADMATGKARRLLEHRLNSTFEE